MKKKIILLCMLILNTSLFAKENFFEDFIKINNSLINKSLCAKQKLYTFYMEQEKVEFVEAISFFSGESQLTYFDNSYFLGTSYGYWIMNNRMKTPLKVSGNYQVQEIEIQDILRIDFEKDYLIENLENNTVNLKRTNKKVLYPFLQIKQISNDEFEILFKDRNYKNVKKALYKKGIVSGFECFSEIRIYDLVFSTKKFLKYATDSIVEIKLPSSMFNQNQMYNLINYIKQNGFID